MATSPQTVKPFDQWLKARAKNYKQISKRGSRARCATTVTLLRRLRAQSLADQFGIFSPNGSGAWLGDNQSGNIAFANMKSLNVVKPMVQLVSTTLASAQVKLDIAAANKDPELGGAANIARGLFEYWNSRDGYWDSNLKNRLATMVCIAYGCFFRSYSDKRKHKVPGQMETQFGQEMMPEAGEYACHTCGTSGPFFGDTQQAGEFSVTRCPQCGKVAEVTKEPSESSMEVPNGESPLMALENKTDVVNPLEVYLDERYSQNANISNVQWLVWHPLYSEEEMKAEFGDYNNYGEPKDWSYSSRWKHAMETGTVLYEKSMSTNSDVDESKFWEVNWIWVRPDQYLTYKVPSLYQLKDASGKVVDEIEPDTQLIEKYPDGFCFPITGDKLLSGQYESDLTQVWDYCGLNPDPMSFYYRPLVDFIQYQDDANTQYTLYMQHLERNAQVGIIYDDRAFDPDSFESDLIPTKEGFSRDESLDYYVKTFTTPPMLEAAKGLEFILSRVLPALGGFQPAAIGAPSPGEPYAAQLLQKQQSLGQLAQGQQSQANAEKGWFKKQCKLAQQWPPAKLEYIRTRLGEEWKEQDIEAFLQCDIDRDINIDILEGSDIPTSLIEREVKINNFITQLAGVPPEFVAAMPPEFLKQVFSQWLTLTGIDADFDNVEAEDRLSTARYMVIKRAAQSKGDPEQVFEQLFGVQQQGPDGQPQTVGGMPLMVVLKGENHADAVEFWTDRQMASHADYDDPQSQFYVVCAEAMIQRHENAKVAKGQGETSQQLQIQAPAMQVQAEMEQGNGEAERAKAESDAQAQQQDTQLKAAQLQADQENAQQKIQSENLRTVTDAEQANADREHEANQSAMTMTVDLHKHQTQLEHDKEQQELTRKAQQEAAKLAAKKPKAVAK